MCMEVPLGNITTLVVGLCLPVCLETGADWLIIVGVVVDELTRGVDKEPELLTGEVVAGGAINLSLSPVRCGIHNVLFLSAFIHKKTN